MEDLSTRLRAAASRMYLTTTVQDASDLEYECRRAGLPSFRHVGGNLLDALADHFRDCAARLDASREVSRDIASGIADMLRDMAASAEASE